MFSLNLLNSVTKKIVITLKEFRQYTEFYFIMFNDSSVQTQKCCKFYDERVEENDKTMRQKDG